MAFLAERDRDTLRQHFEAELEEDVAIRLYTQKAMGLTIPGREECLYCGDTQKLLEEMVALSPKLHLEVHDFYGALQEARQAGVERIPAIVLGADGQGNIKYYGLPAGFEFMTIVESVVSLSKGESGLQEETRRKVAAIDQDVHIQVFVTPT